MRFKEIRHEKLNLESRIRTRELCLLESLVHFSNTLMRYCMQGVKITKSENVKTKSKKSLARSRRFLYSFWLQISWNPILIIILSDFRKFSQTQILKQPLWAIFEVRTNFLYRVCAYCIDWAQNHSWISFISTS